MATSNSDALYDRSLRAILMALLVLGGGCGLPTQGPSVREVVDQAEAEKYELVLVTDAIARKLSVDGRVGFSAQFINAPRLTTGTQLGVGDRINVSIFEAGRDGLFSTDNGNGIVNIPNVVVDPDGTITLPYTGEIQALRQTPEQIEEQIVKSLSGKAIEPQAVVEMSFDANSNVTVSGAVARPARVPLSLRGERLSAALVAAGGARHPAYETYVKLTRRGRSSTASLERIQNDSKQDVALRPDDTITVLHRPASYTVMGSVNRPADVPFSEANISLLEAVGKSSGLLDGRADPGGVFLFRRERNNVLRSHGVAEKSWWHSEKSGIPTVYLVDFRQPKSLFLAQSIRMRDGDVIYVANANAVELRKALSLFGLGVTTAQQTLDLGD